MKASDYKTFIPGSGDTISISTSEIAALNAVVEERATPQQAKMAMEWVMREGCRMNDMSFHLGGLDGQRASDFAEGRKWPGYMIRRVITEMSMHAAVAEDRASHAKRQK